MTAPGPGGYQAPASPAPVSGPGQLARRTDSGPAQAVRDLPDAKYGENRDYQAQQAGAPLAKAPDISAGQNAAPVPDLASAPSSPGPGMITPPDQRTPFGDTSARPDEHVMAGAPIGAGRMGDFAAPPGTANVSSGQLSAALAQHFAEDDTGILRLLADDLAEMGV